MAQEIVTLHVEISSREDRIKELNKELGSRYKYDNMIGKSKPMQNLYNLLDKLKHADSTILIQGENGTGKELIAIMRLIKVFTDVWPYALVKHLDVAVPTQTPLISWHDTIHMIDGGTIDCLRFWRPVGA